MGEEMNYLKAVEYYMEMGMSEEEACHAAFCDSLMNTTKMITINRSKV